MAGVDLDVVEFAVDRDPQRQVGGLGGVPPVRVRTAADGRLLELAADLKEYASFNNDFITWVQGQIKAGKTVEASAAEYKISDKYKGYSVSTIAIFGGLAGNIQAAYKELQKK